MNPHRCSVAILGLVAVLGSPSRSVAQTGCQAELGAVQADLRQFDAGSRRLGSGFLSAADLDRDISAWRQGGSGDLNPRFLAWNDRVSSWEASVRVYSNCLASPTCDINQLVNQTVANDP